MMQAVQVLIERMKSHPDEFLGEIDLPRIARNPKFGDIIEKLDDLLADNEKVGPRNFHRLWFLNDDERTALLDAYKEARRFRFEAKIFHTLLSPETEQEHGRYAQQLGASMTATKNAVATSILSGFGSSQIKSEGTAITVAVPWGDYK
tara:strand:- start:3761 stop:4204 length:444 start_codon:yes stop_codon:yes gene_type:complete